MFGSHVQMDYLANPSGPTITGGTKVVASGSTFYVFTSSGTLSVSGGSVNADVWVIAGGGPGDQQSSNNAYAGGGYAGARTLFSSQTLSGSYTVTVGAGGASASTDKGGSSQFGSLAIVSGGNGGDTRGTIPYTATAAVNNPWSINASGLGGFYYSGTNYYGSDGGWGRAHSMGGQAKSGMPDPTGGGNGAGTQYGVYTVYGGGDISTQPGYPNSGAAGGGFGGEFSPDPVSVPTSYQNGGSGIVIVKIL